MIRIVAVIAAATVVFVVEETWRRGYGWPIAVTFARTVGYGFSDTWEPDVVA